jgi:hypothetical protein
MSIEKKDNLQVSSVLTSFGNFTINTDGSMACSNYVSNDLTLSFNGVGGDINSSVNVSFSKLNRMVICTVKNFSINLSNSTGSIATNIASIPANYAPISDTIQPIYFTLGGSSKIGIIRVSSGQQIIISIDGGVTSMSGLLSFPYNIVVSYNII